MVRRAIGYSSEHDIIASHWAPSWLILQISLDIYNEIVVSIYYRSFKRITEVHFKICGSRNKESMIKDAI